LTCIRYLWLISPIGPISPMQCFYRPVLILSQNSPTPACLHRRYCHE